MKDLRYVYTTGSSMDFLARNKKGWRVANGSIEFQGVFVGPKDEAVFNNIETTYERSEDASDSEDYDEDYDDMGVFKLTMDWMTHKHKNFFLYDYFERNGQKVATIVITRTGAYGKKGENQENITKWCEERMPRINIIDTRNALLQNTETTWKRSANVYLQFFLTKKVQCNKKEMIQGLNGVLSLPIQRQ